MTPNDYQKLALRTDPINTERFPETSVVNRATLRIINGVMGLNGEAGEAVDLVKKALFQGHELDKEHLAKELGDVAWYLAATADAIEYNLDTIFQMNIDKLRARYPDGFDADKSIHRAEGDV